jgi:CRP-like cAMP-binding protein
VCAFYLSRTHFHQLFTSDKLKVHFARRHAIAQNPSARAPADAQRTKTPAQSALLSKAFADNAVFSGLSTAQRDQIVKEMYSRAVPPGTVLIKQGDVGDFLYVVEKGRFAVTIGKKHVGTCVAGKLFGELALMHDAPRAATVTAEAESLVWAIDRGTFRRVISSISAARFATLVDFVSRVPILQALSASEREKVAEALDEVPFPAGSGVCIQGEPGDCLYLVYEGTLGVFKSSGTPGDRGTKVATITAGGYVGERALLMREPRAATVVAETACTLLKLDRSGFLLLLGPIEDALRRRIEEQNAGVAAPQQQTLLQPEADAQADAGPVGRMAEKVPWANLRPVSMLGKGSFGTVRLVEDSATGNTYALKAVNKARAVLMGQTRHLVLEKQCLQALEHPFIAQLIQTHRDARAVYFLSEAVLGGELFTLLRSKSIFSEDAAKFYVASVLLALEHIHARGIIYRDLKPENVLIAADGFIRVVDFGMAKKLGANAEGRTYTLYVPLFSLFCAYSIYRRIFF